MDTPLHRFAAAHDGVISVAYAAALGYDWDSFRAIVRAEGWARLVRSVYLAPGAPDDLRARVRAAQLRQPGLVASHRTAAALHGGDVLAPGLDFTVDGPGRHDVVGGRVYEWLLAPDEVTEGRGSRATTPARTAADLLRACPPHDAVIAVDGLLRAGLVSVTDVTRAVGRAGRRRGVRRARELLRRVDPAAGSVAETKARLVLADAGLAPRTQVLVVDRAARRVRVDLWLEPGVVVEVEGRAFHGSPEQHQGDIARFNELARLPDVTVLRFSWADVFHRPRAVVAAVRGAVAAAERRADAAADPWATAPATRRSVRYGTGTHE